MALGPPDQLLPGQDHPHLLAQRGAAPAHLVGQDPPPGGRLRAGHTGVPGRPAGGRGGPGGPPAAPSRPRRPGRCRPASVGPGPGHVDPDADDDGGQGGPGELRLGQDPGQLGAVEQQVVGPFEHRLDPGDLPAGVGPGQRHGPGAQVHVRRRRSRGGGGPRPADSPPAATPSAGRGGPGRPSGGRRRRPARRAPPGGPGHARRCWWSRPRRASGCPTHRPTWQTP